MARSCLGYRCRRARAGRLAIRSRPAPAAGTDEANCPVPLPLMPSALRSGRSCCPGARAGYRTAQLVGKLPCVRRAGDGQSLVAGAVGEIRWPGLTRRCRRPVGGPMWITSMRSRRCCLTPRGSDSFSLDSCRTGRGVPGEFVGGQSTICCTVTDTQEIQYFDVVTQRSATGILALSTKTPVMKGVDAWVEIDGKRSAEWKVGTDRLELELAPGTYRVSVHSNYRGMHRRIFDKSIEVARDRTKTVNVGP